MFQAIYPLSLASLPGAMPYGNYDELPDSNGMYHNLYIIEDSNFVEQWQGTCDQVIYNTLVRPGAIINCYESKQENVAFELAMYHKYMKKTFRWYELEKELGYCTEWVPVYSEYAPRVREYLKQFDSFKSFW